MGILCDDTSNVRHVSINALVPDGDDAMLVCRPHLGTLTIFNAGGVVHMPRCRTSVVGPFGISCLETPSLFNIIDSQAGAAGCLLPMHRMIDPASVICVVCFIFTLI